MSYSVAGVMQNNFHEVQLSNHVNRYQVHRILGQWVQALRNEVVSRNYRKLKNVRNLGNWILFV